MSLAYLLSAAAIGFSAGMTPGPLQAILLSYAIEGGWKKALPAAFAPLLADVAVIPVVLLILNRLLPFFFTILQFGGAAFMLYLAWESFNAYRHFTSVAPTAEMASPWSTLGKSVAMNLLGPGPWLFWSLINGPNLIRGWAVSPWWGLGYLASFYGVFVLSNIGLILIFSGMRQMGEKVRRSLLLFSVVTLVGFAIYQLLGGLNII